MEASRKKKFTPLPFYLWEGTRYSLNKKLVWSHNRCGLFGEKLLALTGIRTPDRPLHSLVTIPITLSRHWRVFDAQLKYVLRSELSGLTSVTPNSWPLHATACDLCQVSSSTSNLPYGNWGVLPRISNSTCPVDDRSLYSSVQTRIRVLCSAFSGEMITQMHIWP
jgi:hypothetical protein